MNHTIELTFEYVIVNHLGYVYTGTTKENDSENWTKHPQKYFRYTSEGAAKKKSSFPEYFFSCEVMHVDDLKESAWKF